MKKIILFALLLTLLSSCYSAQHLTNYSGIFEVPKVIIDNPNFKILGSFKGKANVYKDMGDILKNHREGAIGEAKKDLLENAKKAGFELVGARLLVNVSMELFESRWSIQCVITAEMLEFEK